jgi:hypothetical protein
MKTYRDSTITLRNRRFSGFDTGRELGALIKLVHQDDSKITWQQRSITDKIVSLVRSRHRGVVNIFNLVPNRLEYVLPAGFLFGFRDEVQVSVYSVDPQPDRFDILSKICHSKDFFHTISPHEFEALIQQQNSFSIVVVDSGFVNEQSTILSCFCKNLSGVMIVENFSHQDTRFNADIYRRYNLSIIETADGYGECWSLW